MSMKAKILELLREKKDRVAAGAPESEAYVSGQELCEQFGVSVSYTHLTLPTILRV